MRKKNAAKITGDWSHYRRLRNKCVERPRETKNKSLQ